MGIKNKTGAKNYNSKPSYGSYYLFIDDGWRVYLVRFLFSLRTGRADGADGHWFGGGHPVSDRRDYSYRPGKFFALAQYDY